MNEVQIFSALTLLHAKNDAALVQDEASVESARARCRAFNRMVTESARHNGEIYYLISPLSGSALNMGRIDLLFAAAYLQGQQQPAQWAESVWRILQSYGQAMLKDGEALQGEEANLAELNRLAEEFAANRLTALKALQIEN